MWEPHGVVKNFGIFRKLRESGKYRRNQRIDRMNGNHVRELEL